MCFDTNHLLTEDNVHFVQQIQKKIVTTHVSDYDFINERHLLPGEGKVAWAALVDALEKTGYNGPLMYEVDLHGNCWVQRDETLCYTDFKRNFDTLVRRETPWIPTDGRKATIKE